jgi:death on curing protein
MTTVKITLDDYLALYRNAVLLYENLEEPIPEINDNTIEKIEYILLVPFQRVFGKVLYWGFYKKAAVLFYLMIKNHPLENGNKRLACLSLFTFYDINKRYLNMSDDDMYNLSKQIAMSDAKQSKLVIEKLKEFLKSIK